MNHQPDRTSCAVYTRRLNTEKDQEDHSMYKALTTIAAGLAITAPAYAGNISAPVVEQPVAVAPAPVAPASPDWTGFYGGAQLGYGDVSSNGALNGDDVIGGISAGYDYDLGSWVLGGGLDYDFADINLGGGTNLENVFRAKLRAGYKVGNGLIYGTGGYAQADTNTTGSEDGYFVGAGYEHMVSQNISVGGEALYHEFENVGGTTTDVEAMTYQAKVNFRF
ncbi:MAG TPA: porin family protein [Roseovarius nubinhibens]|uniref:Porin family protein n=2 Tax=Roseovarius nubinhibens TaxID=314263 RepID=A0A348WFD1_9RHOB|nr:porin family protein [Roseovarius nubinhibens]|tara:strand:- start:756 stop:1421 length:666 start_codon:yes stop_codon:yes gene_type:complete